jgi:hypothetical protein
MKTRSRADDDQRFESFNTLLQIIQNDPLIHHKINALLTLNSFQRRSVLNYWLEHLTHQNSHENLCQALVCLFDDKIAKKVLKIIRRNDEKSIFRCGFIRFYY